MIPAVIRRWTRSLLPDHSWPRDVQDWAGQLFFRDEEGPLGPMMVSEWAPTAAQLARLNAGARVRLIVLGDSHPHVALDVAKELVAAEPDDIEAAA